MTYSVVVVVVRYVAGGEAVCDIQCVVLLVVKLLLLSGMLLVVKQCVTYSVVLLLSGMLLVVKQCVTYSVVVVVVRYVQAVCDIQCSCCCQLMYV